MEEIGAQDRLAEMVDCYQKLIFSVCYRMTGDYFAAEDLTQETFLSAYQKWDSFDGANEKAWICRIAANKSIDYLRSAGRKQVPTEDAFFHHQEERHNLPEQVLIENEIKQRLSQCCEKLKYPYNEIARAYYLEERSASEIAAERQAKLKTIQTQIYRTREQLRDMFGKEELI